VAISFRTAAGVHVARTLAGLWEEKVEFSFNRVQREGMLSIGDKFYLKSDRWESRQCKARKIVL
jgi:hypothetical protein